MPTNRRRRPPRRNAVDAPLHPYCIWELLASNGCGGTWHGPDHRRQAWFPYRDRILELWVERFPGTRPFGFWQFEADPPRPATQTEREYLTEHGLLTEAERQALSGRRRRLTEQDRLTALAQIAKVGRITGVPHRLRFPGI